MKVFLPLGTVVKLRDQEQLVMIYGRAQTAQNNAQYYDYIACPYPVGSTDTKQGILFSEQAIERICYIGFQDEDELHYRHALAKYLEEKNEA